MKKSLLNLIFISLSLKITGIKTFGQRTPEILFYRFNDTGKTVKNLASSPPTGSSTATLNGDL
ncbi:MAG: hypothetical protein HUU47_10025 [Bacteroidetes bacterium]|nr:hypothetical protein [Bacteroidota bacterium]